MNFYRNIPINRLYLELSRCGRNYYHSDNNINIKKIRKIIELLNSNLTSENLTFHVPRTIKMSEEDINLIFNIK